MLTTFTLSFRRRSDDLTLCFTISISFLLGLYIGSGDSIRVKPVRNSTLQVCHWLPCCTTEDRLILEAGYVMLR